MAVRDPGCERRGSQAELVVVVFPGEARSAKDVHAALPKAVFLRESIEQERDH